MFEKQILLTSFLKEELTPLKEEQIIQNKTPFKPLF